MQSAHTIAEARVRALLEAGDPTAAATTALEQWGPEILGYLHGVLWDEDAASDVFSQFCEDLWRGLEGFRGHSSFRTWSYTLARNALARHFRDPARRRARRLATDELATVAAHVRTRTLPHLRTTVRDRFTALRRQLPPDDQTLLILRVDRRLPWTDVAEVLSASDRPITPAAAKMRFQRLKDRLRRLAEAEGLLGDA